jgi:hypothetical protein
MAPSTQRKYLQMKTNIYILSYHYYLLCIFRSFTSDHQALQENQTNFLNWIYIRTIQELGFLVTSDEDLEKVESHSIPFA